MVAEDWQSVAALEPLGPVVQLGMAASTEQLPDGVDDSGVEIDSTDDDEDWIPVDMNVPWFIERDGRGYHNSGYPFPIDEMEQKRQDIQCRLSQIAIGVALAISRPKTCVSPQALQNERVLDLCTGTGTWAICHAEENPRATVIGVDIIPIQPTSPPSNCTFYLRDIEEDWRLGRFDRIFLRFTAGCFAEPQSLFHTASMYLRPGGYFELHDVLILPDIQDGTAQDSWFKIYLTVLVLVASQNGYALDCPKKYKTWMQEAGYEEICERTYEWPLAGASILLRQGLEGFSMTHLIKLGWPRSSAQLLCDLAEKEMENLGNRRICDYFKMYTIYGRKPAVASDLVDSPNASPGLAMERDASLETVNQNFMAQVRRRLVDEERRIHAHQQERAHPPHSYEEVSHHNPV